MATPVTAPSDSPRIRSTSKNTLEPEPPASDESEVRADEDLRRRPTPCRLQAWSQDLGQDVSPFVSWRRRSTRGNTWRKEKL
ncbi:hypothetical protein NDU88_004404 [Pleurodeles waltl]|uniref:Uncharacterized protein n=1 Tax=Pleurodeles waltl TaxID=8319 RepID=A0AAV7PCE0_PLEWA|nr:hypothetical protein NDU88_004404 [Pleurodeles waltl]